MSGRNPDREGYVMNFYYIIVSLLGLLSLILLTIGTGMISTESKKHKQYTQETTARVKELKEKKNGKPGKPGAIRYYPVFEYRANGQFLRVESKVGSDKPAYKVGEEVKICYNPDSKRDFYIPGNTTAVTVGSAFTVLGIIAVMITLGVSLRLKH